MRPVRRFKPPRGPPNTRTYRFPGACPLSFESYPATAPPSPSCRVLRAAAAGSLALCSLAAIGWVFWIQDLQYATPTPRPSDWQRAAEGVRIALPGPIAALRDARPGQPLLLHFFNPACPCSRFNVEHVRALEARFGREVVFVAVLAEGDAATMRRAYRALPLTLPSYVDADHSLADALGIYSTPQAAVLDRNGRLFYQGNYNVTRFCRDRDTEFARLALESIIGGRPLPRFSSAAGTAYGCPLPARAATHAGI